MKPIPDMTADEAGAELKRRLDLRAAAIEAIVTSAFTSETKKGKIRKVSFTLHNDGEHPFAGMVGDRLLILPIKINDDETLEHGQRASVAGDGCAAPRQSAAVGGPDNPGRPCFSPASGDGTSPEEEPGGKGGEEPSGRRARSDAERKRWDELPAATQIVLACKDRSFRRYLTPQGHLILTEEEAEKEVKRLIGSDRKRAVQPGTSAFEEWQTLYSTFTAERDYGSAA